MLVAGASELSFKWKRTLLIISLSLGHTLINVRPYELEQHKQTARSDIDQSAASGSMSDSVPIANSRRRAGQSNCIAVTICNSLGAGN